MSDRIERARCIGGPSVVPCPAHFQSCEGIVELLLSEFLGKPIWMWLLFMGLVIALLVFDLGVLNKDDHKIGIAESLKLSAMYITLGIAFSGFIYWTMGGEATAQYLTAFIVEKTLAMDNIFVIALIFSFFAIPREYQHRVLFWGILGVILLRGIMIGLGATIVENYHWVLYLFAAFLIFTGIKMLFASDDHTDMADNKALKLAAPPHARHGRASRPCLHGQDPRSQDRQAGPLGHAPAAGADRDRDRGPRLCC